MNRKQRIQISISTFLVFVVGVFVWQYWENQKVQNDTEPELFQGTLLGRDGDDVDDESDQDEGEEPLDADDPLNIPETEEEVRKSSAYVVDGQVCQNECVVYRNDPEALAYCQAVCGFAPTEGGKREVPSSCDDRTDTAKDICWRDKAVAEKDSSLCQNIVDQNLRQSCHNRIAEEYFDK